MKKQVQEEKEKVKLQNRMDDAAEYLRSFISMAENIPVDAQPMPLFLYILAQATSEFQKALDVLAERSEGGCSIDFEGGVSIMIESLVFACAELRTIRMAYMAAEEKKGRQEH